MKKLYSRYGSPGMVAVRRLVIDESGGTVNKELVRRVRQTVITRLREMPGCRKRTRSDARV